jgi:hypothetical protein
VRLYTCYWYRGYVAPQLSIALTVTRFHVPAKRSVMDGQCVCRIFHKCNLRLRASDMRRREIRQTDTKESEDSVAPVFRVKPFSPKDGGSVFHRNININLLEPFQS